MKKTAFVAAMAIAAATFTSCGNSAPKANLKDNVDTLAYAIGVAQAQGLDGYLVQMGLDSTYTDTFLKGFIEGANAGDDKKQSAYYQGVQVGQNFANQLVKGVNMEAFGNDSTKSISLKNLIAGFVSAAKKEKTAIAQDQAQAQIERLMTAVRAEQFKDVKEAGEKFMAKKAKEEGVKKLANGVLYKVIKEGNGPIPKDTSTVKVNYEGKTIDGTVFDSSYERKQPTSFKANQVVKGWTEALTHMPVGSTWELYIPQDQAYGPRQAGANIKPYSALIFKLELLGIE